MFDFPEATTHRIRTAELALNLALEKAAEAYIRETMPKREVEEYYSHIATEEGAKEHDAQIEEVKQQFRCYIASMWILGPWQGFK